jgi:hypothetical protein
MTDLVAPSVPEVGESVDKDHCLVVGIALLNVVWKKKIEGVEKGRGGWEGKVRNGEFLSCVTFLQ